MIPLNAFQWFTPAEGLNSLNKGEYSITPRENRLREKWFEEHEHSMVKDSLITAMLCSLPRAETT
jgi:hypothetical protein|tara:strand:- start:2489 stop:2683 length:195 start_codon:yes stop_codon:yes gene_type:complete